MVSGIDRLIDKSIWHPDAFLRDFGDQQNDFIDVLNGKLLKSQPMKTFWEGFECLPKRLKDRNGQPMILKLKVN